MSKWIRKRTGSQTTDNNTATRHFVQRTHKSASWIYIMADNKKQEKDFTKEVDAILPEAASLAKARRPRFQTIYLDAYCFLYSPVNCRMH